MINAKDMIWCDVIAYVVHYCPLVNGWSQTHPIAHLERGALSGKVGDMMKMEGDNFLHSMKIFPTISKGPKANAFWRICGNLPIEEESPFGRLAPGCTGIRGKYGNAIFAFFLFFWMSNQDTDGKTRFLPLMSKADFGPEVLVFLSDPGVPGVWSMSPDVSNWLSTRGFAAFTDVTLADEDSNSIPTDDVQPQLIMSIGQS